MNRIKLATLTKADLSAIVYYDDYWDDYCENETLNDTIPKTQSDATMVGDKKTEYLFEDFMLDRKIILGLGYYPMPWSRGRTLAMKFAEKYGYEIELTEEANYVEPERRYESVEKTIFINRGASKRKKMRRYKQMVVV